MLFECVESDEAGLLCEIVRVRDCGATAVRVFKR